MNEMILASAISTLLSLPQVASPSRAPQLRWGAYTLGCTQLFTWSRRRRCVALGHVHVLVAGCFLFDQRLQQPNLAQQPRTAYTASYQ